tara:strand:- start:813 stop:1064 length:252 start_codon:yes stop_codon:yes gene_type:complete
MKPHQKRSLIYQKTIEDFFGGYVCKRCGFKGKAAQFDCHHLPEYEKVRPITQFRRIGNRETFINELKKCELLCANCHRLEHSS